MVNKKAKKGSGMIIVFVIIAAVLLYMVLTPGKQFGLFSTVNSINYDTCIPQPLGNQTNLASNYFDTPLGAGDCGCGLLSCAQTLNPSSWNVSCATNGAGYDCQGNTIGGPTISSQFIARVNGDSPNGAQTLEILGRRAIACTSKQISVTPGKTYTLSFWFKHVQGNNGFDVSTPMYCIYRTGSGSLTSDCQPSKNFLVNDTGWHYYQEPFTVPTGTQDMGLYFYSNGGEGEGINSVTINRYSDIRVVEGSLPCTQTQPVVPNCVQNLQCINGATVDANNCGGIVSTDACSPNFFMTTVFTLGTFNVTWWMLIAVLAAVVLIFIISK